MTQLYVAVIIDLVDSRQLPSRAAMQPEIERSFAVVNERVAYQQPIEATIGDEFQALYSTTAGALEATMLARLGLPEGVDCRFGLGRGEAVTIGAGAAGILQDGLAWWLAREAIDEAHRRQDSRTPSARSWYRSDPSADAPGDSVSESLINSYLIMRDHVIGSMTERSRRITFGSMTGRSQQELADHEGISQSAVSQSLRRSGGASLIATLEVLKLGCQ
ncbi:MAG: SatD family protein [Lacisediminihabitans sp.]